MTEADPPPSDPRDAPLLDALAAALRQQAPGARRLVVAVSGGGDSLALLSLLRVLPGRQPEPTPELVVAHFDHQLRPGSAADAAWVAALAARWRLPFEGGAAAVAQVAAARGWNLEDAARRLRYQFLHRVAAEHDADRIAVAHSRDDQAETALLQLLRGAAFLRGMAPRRGRLVRPLLTLGRAELRAHLQRTGLDPRHDPSNHDPGRRRAALRATLLPTAERIAPGASARIARHTELQRDLAEFVTAEAERRLGRDSLALGALRKAPPALQRTALAELLRAAGAPVELATLEALRARLERPGSWRIDVGAGVRLRAHGGRLAPLGSPPAPPPPRPLAELAAAGAAPARGAAPPPTELLERAHAGEALWWRGRRPGDTIRLPGGSRSVAELMIDRKIPREARDAIPLIARGSEVLWIAGVAVAVGIAVGDPARDPDPERSAMRAALVEARSAAAAGEVPIGALLLAPDGSTLARAGNRTRRDSDPSAHAEIVALRTAALARGDWRLEGCTLVVTLEPCPMCFGAALQAHLRRIVYGADNRRDGAAGSVVDLGAAPTKRRLELRGGLLATDSERLLERFFASKRSVGGVDLRE